MPGRPQSAPLHGLPRRVLAAWNSRSRTRRTLIIVVGLLILLAALLLPVPGPAALRQWSRSAGAVFVPVFWLLYVGITQFPIPRTILTVSAGVLLGPVAGMATALSATTVSAGLSLVLMRVVLGVPVRGVAPRVPDPRPGTAAGRSERLRRRLEERGWVAVIGLRMIAAVPFSVLNYAAAASPVRPLPFTFATFLGSAPGTVITVLLGEAIVAGPSPGMLAPTAVLTLLGLTVLFLEHGNAVRSSRYTGSRTVVEEEP